MNERRAKEQIPYPDWNDMKLFSVRNHGKICFIMKNTVRKCLEVLHII